MNEKKTFKPKTKRKMENVGEYLQSINQGVGVHRTKKDKLKSRKKKHKKQLKDYL